MDIAISTACFYPEVFTEDTIKIIAGMGFKTIEVFLETASEYQEDYCKRLKENADSHGLSVYSVHSFAIQHEPFLFDKYGPRKKDAWDTFLRVVKGAEILGAKHITFHGPSRKWFGNEASELMDIAAEMDSLAESAAAHDVSLAWENVYWCLSHDPDLMQLVMDNTTSPNINFTLDLKQANRSGIPVERYLEIMGQRLVTVHINDFSPGSMCLLPGRGKVDYPALFETLERTGYQGPFIIEVYRNNFDHYDELAVARDFLMAAGSKE
ncbi:MAG: sugar phosphate isomerase/epimerase family protein [Clostridia bacterium]|jgi:sugar phosphate isomerase/epimerase|nr:sugar phosphate isomerase/epimerase [Clostridiales bacterium]